MAIWTAQSLYRVQLEIFVELEGGGSGWVPNFTTINIIANSLEEAIEGVLTITSVQDPGLKLRAGAVEVLSYEAYYPVQS